MSNNKDLESLTIKLEPELRRRMLALVDAGIYSSYNEMIRDGIRHVTREYKEEIEIVLEHDDVPVGHMDIHDQ